LNFRRRCSVNRSRRHRRRRRREETNTKTAREYMCVDRGSNDQMMLKTWNELPRDEENGGKK